MESLTPSPELENSQDPLLHGQTGYLPVPELCAKPFERASLTRYDALS